MRVPVCPSQADTSHTQWLPLFEPEAATDVTAMRNHLWPPFALQLQRDIATSRLTLP
jgi:hypothetical protein